LHSNPQIGVSYELLITKLGTLSL